MDVIQVVREVVAAETNFPIDKLTEATRLEDIDADSLARLNIMFEIEKRLDLPIRDEDLSKLETVGDVCTVANELMKCAT